MYMIPLSYFATPTGSIMNCTYITYHVNFHCSMQINLTEIKKVSYDFVSAMNLIVLESHVID